MSFMFHPSAYEDPKAVDRMPMPETVKGKITQGTLSVARKITVTVQLSKIM